MPYLLTYFTFYFPHVGIFSPQLGNFIFQVREQKKRAHTLNVSTREQHLLCQLIGILLCTVFLYRLNIPLEVSLCYLPRELPTC